MYRGLLLIQIPRPLPTASGVGSRTFILSSYRPSTYLTFTSERNSHDCSPKINLCPGAYGWSICVR